jgi:hypothetical protein
MFRNRGVECDKSADWQIGEEKKRQAHKGGEVALVSPDHPVDERTDEKDSQKRLKFAP